MENLVQEKDQEITDLNNQLEGNKKKSNSQISNLNDAIAEYKAHIASLDL